MDGGCNITSKHGNHWTDVIQNLGMRLCDIEQQDFVIHCKKVDDIYEAYNIDITEQKKKLIKKGKKVLRQLKRIDYLKMDCEGAEYDILFKCKDSVLRKIKKIGMEPHYIDEKKNVNELKTFLVAKGFHVSAIPNRQMLYATRING